MVSGVETAHRSCLDRQDKKLNRFRFCVVVIFAAALVAGVPSSPAVAADWDWLEEQGKKLFDDVYEGTKDAVTGEFAQPPEEDDPAPEVQAQESPAAAPSPQESQPQTPQVQVADTPRFDKPWVTEIQTHLTTLGYNPGAIDGAFGNKSQLAITAFQQHRGDPVTGLPTPSVMAALRSESQAETVAAAPAATEQPAADPSANTPSSPIKTIDKAELDKAAFPLAAYTPNNLAHSDAVITVCGGTRDPMLRENAVAMIEVWRGDNSEGTVQSYDKIFDIFVNGFTKTDRCFDRDKNTAADAYTEYQRYQTQVITLSAELRADGAEIANSEPGPESVTAAPTVAEQPAAVAGTDPVNFGIERIDKTDLDKAAFPRAAYTPNNLAHSDAVITVCGGTRDPMLRENAVAMIEVWRGDNSEGTVQNYDKIFDIFVNGFTKTGRCFDREKNTTTAADAYTEYQRYQTRVLELSAELRIAEVDTASAEPVAESAPTPPVAHPVPWTQVCLTRRA